MRVDKNLKLAGVADNDSIKNDEQAEYIRGAGLRRPPVSSK